jgi:hypothetical protein
MSTKKFFTRTKLFKIFFPQSTVDPVPDAVEMFDAFGIKLFSGWIDTTDLVDHITVDSLFSTINQFITEKSHLDAGEYYDRNQKEQEQIERAYYTKTIYWGDPTGRSWHTPIFGIHQNRGFVVFKGLNKILAAKLGKVKRLPILAGAFQKDPPFPEMTKIKTDQQMLDFFSLLSNGQVRDPELGLEFRYSNGSLIPILHWINISPEAAARPDTKIPFLKDCKNWKEFYFNRVVLSDMLPSVGIPGFNHQIFPGKLNNRDHIRQYMTKGTVAYIYCDGDSEMCARLSRALVWLSSDESGSLVGELMSEDKRYRIVFNNNSDLKLTIPPGILLP